MPTKIRPAHLALVFAVVAAASYVGSALIMDRPLGRSLLFALVAALLWLGAVRLFRDFLLSNAAKAVAALLLVSVFVNDLIRH